MCADESDGKNEHRIAQLNHEIYGAGNEIAWCALE